MSKTNTEKKEPIDIILDQVELYCTICGAKQGDCDCWTKCECGWLYEKGTECRNPIHNPEE